MALESLVFYENLVAGSIPPEIGKLNLTDFLAYGNLMAGTIPDEFYKNEYLVDLRLENNTFSGTISTAIGNLTRLQSLRLGDNGFQGTLPTELLSLSDLGKDVIVIIFDAWQALQLMLVSYISYSHSFAEWNVIIWTNS